MAESLLTPIIPNGTVFSGRYRVERPVGAGGMGRVYRAVDLRSGQPVALKTPHVSSSEVARFSREVRSLECFDHPNLCRLHEAGIHTDGRPFMVTDWVEGTSLESVLRDRGTLPVTETIQVANGVLSALAHVHSRGFLHRDVKPANVVVSHDLSIVKLVDFGLAKPTHPVDRGPGFELTSAQFVMGTPHYMAPEAVRGLQVDGRADVYSTGVMIYQMLSGEMPIDGVGDELLQRILRHQSTPLRERLPWLPAKVADWVEMAMHAAPDDRFQSAGHFALALDACDAFDWDEETDVTAVEVPLAAMPSTRRLAMVTG